MVVFAGVGEGDSVRFGCAGFVADLVGVTAGTDALGGEGGASAAAIARCTSASSVRATLVG